METSIINLVLSLAGALVLHELGHLLAARLCHIPVTEAGLGWGPKLAGIRFNRVDYQLRALPLGAYIRMDMRALQQRPLRQQLLVLLAGIAMNLMLGALSWGTAFGAFNLAIALGNLLPLYQLDGWKSGMVIFRRMFKRSSPLVEWAFTISGALTGLVLLVGAILSAT